LRNLQRFGAFIAATREKTMDDDQNSYYAIGIVIDTGGK
jgi:hypothetical protein